MTFYNFSRLNQLFVVTNACVEHFAVCPSLTLLSQRKSPLSHTPVLLLVLLLFGLRMTSCSGLILLSGHLKVQAHIVSSQPPVLDKSMKKFACVACCLTYTAKLMFALQVMLQPRCLLLMQGQACNNYTHSIASQDADVVSAACSNLSAAKVQVGQRVHRAQRRVSLVFVHKQHAAWLC